MFNHQRSFHPAMSDLCHVSPFTVHSSIKDRSVAELMKHYLHPLPFHQGTSSSTWMASQVLELAAFPVVWAACDCPWLPIRASISKPDFLVYRKEFLLPRWSTACRPSEDKFISLCSGSRIRSFDPSSLLFTTFQKWSKFNSSLFHADECTREWMCGLWNRSSPHLNGQTQCQVHIP